MPLHRDAGHYRIEDGKRVLVRRTLSQAEAEQAAKATPGKSSRKPSQTPMATATEPPKPNE